MINDAPKWRFRPHSPEERASDDYTEELFRNSRNMVLAESLVRETIQNSLDANDDSPNPIRVRFAISTVSFSEVDPFVGELFPRLESPDLQSIETPSKKDAVRILTIEDFGTVGLEGDPARYDDPEGNSKDRYWEFWRNLGRGNRGEARRGRWGLGKSVFHISSKIGTYFGFTTRRSDQKQLLMGISQLKVHYLENQRYDSYGYFGLQDDNHFTHPIQDNTRQNSFSNVFNITRSSQPGLSLVITFSDPAIDRESIIEASVKGYFLPLLTGELIIEVEDHGNITEIDQDYVNELPTITGLNDGTIEMARFAISNPNPIENLINDPPLNASARWPEIEFNQQKLEELAETLKGGSMVEIELPIFVHPSATPSTLTSFRVILREEPDRSARDAMFIRNGIHITDVKHLSPRGYSALIITDKNDISSFLGDSENPAHTQWKANRQKFGRKYKHWNPTIDFVANSAFAITEQLTPINTEADPDLFSDVFFVELGAAAKKPRKPKPVMDDDDDLVITDPPDIPELKGSKFKTTEIPGGFHVAAGDLCPAVPFRVRIKMAYTSKNSRSSTKNWSPFDFDMKTNSMQINATYASVAERERNELVLDVTDQNFNVSITGFDEKRDLFVPPPHVLEVE